MTSLDEGILAMAEKVECLRFDRFAANCSFPKQQIIAIHKIKDQRLRIFFAVCKAQAGTHCSAVNVLIASSCEMISKEQKEHFYVRELSISVLTQQRCSWSSPKLEAVISKDHNREILRASHLFQFEWIISPPAALKNKARDRLELDLLSVIVNRGPSASSCKMTSLDEWVEVLAMAEKVECHCFDRFAANCSFAKQQIIAINQYTKAGLRVRSLIHSFVHSFIRPSVRRKFMQFHPVTKLLKPRSDLTISWFEWAFPLQFQIFDSFDFSRSKKRHFKIFEPNFDDLHGVRRQDMCVLCNKSFY